VKVCLDIGAAWGEFSKDVSNKNYFDSFYLVEPNDYFVKGLKRIRGSKILTVALVPQVFAGSPVTLYKTRNSELSSLFPPRDLSNVGLWRAHAEGYRTMEVSEVSSITLDELIQRVRIETGFTSLQIKLDIQGLDFTVVSESKLIGEADIVVLEVPYNAHVSLSNRPEELNLADVMKGLKKIGFQVLRIVPNGGGEANITLFSNRLTLEQALEREELSGFSSSWILKLGPKPLAAKWRTLNRNVRNRLSSLLV
jgi:FkbM family methyltransferase